MPNQRCRTRVLKTEADFDGMTATKKTGSPPRGRRRRGRGRSRSAGNRPVPLHKRSASHFQRGDRQRGQEYFQEGRVRLEVDGHRARSRVDGTERGSYAVGVDWSRVGDRVLHAFCECPRFADRRPCKHLWATLLALETALESQPPGRDRVSLRKDRAASWRDLGVAAGQGNQGGGGNTESKSTDRELKRKAAIELRTRARGFDD